MSVLSDRQITRELGETGRIKPFEPAQITEGVVSSGVSSYGYDVRVGYKFKVFTNVWGSVIDPKNFDPKAFVDVDVSQHAHSYKLAYGCQKYECVKCGYQTSQSDDQSDIPDHVLIPPNSFALAETIEWFDMPRDCIVLAIPKSTYARCGIMVTPTVMEPEWKGTITIEISNTAPLPAKVYAGEGIAQLLFFRSDERLEELMSIVEHEVYGWRCVDRAKNASCGVSYADKNGRYNDQKGITLPFVKRS